MPFEAAQRGTPCVFAWHTSLSEVLQETAARSRLGTGAERADGLASCSQIPAADTT
jgi:hypothetical protein